MKTKIKICGIRKIESAQVACQQGADFLSFNFIPSSRRFVDPLLAKKIIARIGKKVKTVGIFQNFEAEKINNLVDFLNLDFVQLHGSESNKFCQLIKTKVIKAFCLPANFDLEKTLKLMKSYSVDFYLLDRANQGKGALLNLGKVAKIVLEFPTFFAGGLTSENVEKVLKEVRPYGVDVAGGIETKGREDLAKIKEFITKVKSL